MRAGWAVVLPTRQNRIYPIALLGSSHAEKRATCPSSPLCHPEHGDVACRSITCYYLL